MFTRKPKVRPADSEAQQNAQSIRDIPLDVFPDGPARRMCIERAGGGEEIYAYRPVAADWVIWHYRGNWNEDCRLSPEAWARREGYALRDGGAA